MLGDSQFRIPVNSCDTIGSQQKAGERWHDEFFRSHSQSDSKSTRTESTSVDRSATTPFGKVEMLDLFPSPYDIWAQKIEGIGKPKKPSLIEGGNKIQEGTKPGDVVPAGKESGEQAQPTAMQRLARTVTEYQAGGNKLTPSLREKFEDVIVASDAPSPLVPPLSKRLSDLRNEGSALLTPEKKREIDQTKAELQSAVKALPQGDAKKFQDLAYIRSLAKGDRELTTSFEAQMETVAPGVLSKLKAYEKAVEPLTKIEKEYAEVSDKLSTELGQNLITRSTYADLLLKDGDKQTAERYLREAYEKAPSIIENQEFVELMIRAGIKVEDLQKPTITNLPPP